MDKKNDDNNKEASSRLAEVIAGQDINGLKDMILDQMGIDDQDALIDRVLNMLEDEDETPSEDDNQADGQVVELYKNQEEPQASKQSSFDPLDLLLNNKDLIFNLLKNRMMDGNAKDDPRVQLLHALKPFCNDKRQSRIEQAVQMMGITRYLGKSKSKE